MKIHLEEGTGVPYWRQIRDDLSNRIRSGQLAPGSPLPSIRELAADSLVSVITIKKAYEELESLGLAYSHQGRGTFVSPKAGEAGRLALFAEIVAAAEAAVKRAAEAGVPEAEITAAIDDALRRAYPTRA